MKQVSGSMKLELAQYREMEAFAQFASDLDPATQKLLARGARLTLLLKQPQYSPLAVEEQVGVIFAGTKGYLDDVAIEHVELYEQRLLEAFRTSGVEILAKIKSDKKINEDTEKDLRAFIEDFTKGFEG